MTETVRPANPLPRWEAIGAAFILLSFLFVSLLVATRTPTVYCDEVEYVDPAANLYFGNGFTSTMWAQEHHEFWCGNVPLFQGFLYGAFKIFGFGLLQTRMTCLLLTAGGALFIWSALRRNQLVASPVSRLLALSLVLSGSVSTQTFRMARYDATMFFVCAGVFWAASLPTRRLARYLAVILFSALLPAAGIPMLPYAALLLGIYFLVYPFKNFGVVISVVFGFALGIGGLLLFYNHFGVLKQFVQTVLPFTLVGHGEPRSLQHSIFGDSLGDENLITSFFGNPLRFLDAKTLFDYSAFLLFLVVVVIVWKTWRAADKPTRKLMVFILATTLLVPPALHLAAHYRSYYRWMTYIPLAIVVPRLLEVSGGFGCALRFRFLAVCAICFSLLLGVPFRTVAAFPDWSRRSTAPLNRVTGLAVKPSDIVVCHQKAYFAFKPRVQLLYCFALPARGEFDLIKDMPTNQVSLLCLPPENLNEVVSVTGGNWEEISFSNDKTAVKELNSSRYAVNFYRRK